MYKCTKICNYSIKFELNNNNLDILINNNNNLLPLYMNKIIYRNIL